MNELETRATLRNKTVDVLVAPLIQRSKLITELEMEGEICRENKK